MIFTTLGREKGRRFSSMQRECAESELPAVSALTANMAK